ncbi:hypothetical protein EDB81DRAFT_875109 [Dactylonectria macrodidyma]|uniref:Uncharacterized protein n=1 Tax=Dactylonectria macrodidyma TaxID=307937 RepID=A0A9P9JN26_9HYPO|nr:hypothetical protein EDB81DRAFT_875109 [Dactylonectria macrodidyma]
MGAGPNTISLVLKRSVLTVGDTRTWRAKASSFDIFPPGYEYPDGHEPPEPENLDEIRRALEQPRASLSPSRFTREDFKKFQRADDHATKESRVTAIRDAIIERDPSPVLHPVKG